jgi:Mg2+/Co2+ transporter CorC
MHAMVVKYDLFNLADSMSVWNLLREFRIRQVHMAVVLNEYGGTIGVRQENPPLHSLILQNTQLGT